MCSFKKVIDIEYVANLARIRLTEAEKERFSKDLANILAYIEKLNQLDTENTVPTSHVVAIQNVFREDKTSPSLPQDAALSNAPEKQKGLFKVPKIL